MQEALSGVWSRHQLFVATHTGLHCIFVAAHPDAQQPFIDVSRPFYLLSGLTAWHAGILHTYTSGVHIHMHARQVFFAANMQACIAIHESTVRADTDAM